MRASTSIDGASASFRTGEAAGVPRSNPLPGFPDHRAAGGASLSRCPWCGQSNETGARFCGACGRPTAGDTLPAPAAAPANAARERTPRRLRFKPNLRLILPALLVLVFVFTLLSLGTAWWSYSTSAGGGNLSINFLPGSNYYLTCSGSCSGFSAGAFPYSVVGGSVGSIYGGVLGVLVAAGILAGLVALFGVLTALGRELGRWQSFLTFLFGGVVALLLLATVAWTATGQPGAFPPGFHFMGSTGSGASVESSFWGSSPGGGASWGAGPGWYLALAGAVLLGGVMVLLPLLTRRPARSRPRPTPAPPRTPVAPLRTFAPPPTRPAFAHLPMRPPPAPAARPATAGTPAAPSSPTSTPSEEEPAVPAGYLPCPTCGTPNLAKSRVCSYCQRSLR